MRFTSALCSGVPLSAPVEVDPSDLMKERKKERERERERRKGKNGKTFCEQNERQKKMEGKGPELLKERKKHKREMIFRCVCDIHQRGRHLDAEGLQDSPFRSSSQIVCVSLSARRSACRRTASSVLRGGSRFDIVDHE